MVREPKIPMLPGDVPRQRIRLVVDLPPRPKSFRGFCDLIDPMPETSRPKGSPRNTEYLGSVEWASSPMNSRFDSYYLNPRGRYWLLWIRWQDDDWKQGWQWTLYAYGSKKGVDAKSAGVYLLTDAWKAERDSSQLDRYLLIDEAGSLSVEEISEIARNVWPEESSDRDATSDS